MPNATPSGSLPTVGRGWASPFSHNTGSMIRLLVVLDGHVESTTPFSANPTICPRLLIALACPLFPPSVGRALMWKNCQRNGRHVRCVPKPQMSSPFGSGTAVSESPTTCPKSLISPQFIQLFCPPSVPRSSLNPATSINARPFRSVPPMLSCCPGGRFPAMISVQPSLLTDMAQPRLSFPSAPKSVTLYLTCAPASLKQARIMVVTHGIQEFRNCLSIFMSPLFLR